MVQYAKYISETEIQLPPTNCNGISNYCHCEEKLLADGYLPLIVEEEPTADKYVKKYRLESDAIYQYTVADTSDCNNYTKEGEYYLGVGLHGNCPFGVACQFALIVSVYNGVIVQEAIGLDVEQKRYKRSCVNGVWGEWAELGSGGDVVNLTDGQTIDGIKTFKNQIVRRLPVDRANPELSYLASGVRFEDANGLELGQFRWERQSNGKYIMQMVVLSPDGTKNSSIYIGYDANNNVYTHSPTPTTADNSNKIATTTYVNNKHQVVSTLPASPDSNVFYYIPE